MSNRFVLALALSGALHAAVFAAASGMHRWLLAGLEYAHDPETLTVSVVSARSLSSEVTASTHPSHAGRQESRHADGPTRARNSPATPLAARRTANPSPKPVATKPAPAPRHKPDRSVASTSQDRAAAAEVPDAAAPPSRDHTASEQAVASAAAPSNSRDSAPNGAGGKAAERTYLAEFLAALSRHKHYPQSARLRRQEGRVVVALVLKNDGTINDVQIKEASRFPLLNRAALRSVRQLDRFKPFPAGIDRSVWRLSVPFQYAIRDP